MPYTYIRSDYTWSSEHDWEEQNESEPESEAAPYEESLRNALNEVCEVDTFCTGGKLKEVPLPVLRIDGLTPALLGLPLQEEQAKLLSALCEQAPFGRGEDTVVDLAVRCCRQLDSSKIHLGTSWNERIQQLAAQASKKMGVEAEVRANLYKLLIYEEGGFFKSHKDTEKESGMFGTLAVQLPSEYSSGSFVVRHRGEERSFNFSKGSSTHFFYTAFYADCEHELTEVRGGNRLVLLYNLVRCSNGNVPRVVPVRAELQDTVTKAAQEWVQTKGNPERFVVRLKHKYTAESLSISQLKGCDYVIANVLRGSAQFILQLALVQLHKFYYYDSGSGDVSKDSKVLKVIFEEGDPRPLFHISTKEIDLLSKERIFVKGGEADRDTLFPNMGNEGSQRNRWYNEAVLVVWPRERFRSMKYLNRYDDAVKDIQESMDAEIGDAESTLHDVLRYAKRSAMSSKALASVLNIAVTLKSNRCIARAFDILEGFWAPEVLVAIEYAIKQSNWEDIRANVLSHIQATPFEYPYEHIYSCVSLVLKLQKTENMEDVACAVARATLRTALSKGLTNSPAEVCKVMCAFSSFAEEREEFLIKVTQESAATISSVIQDFDKNSLAGEGSHAAKQILQRLVTAYLSKQPFQRWSWNEPGDVLGALLQLESELTEEFVDALIASGNSEVMKRVFSNEHVSAAKGNAHIRKLSEALESTMSN